MKGNSNPFYYKSLLCNIYGLIWLKGWQFPNQQLSCYHFSPHAVFPLCSYCTFSVHKFELISPSACRKPCTISKSLKAFSACVGRAFESLLSVTDHSNIFSSKLHGKQNPKVSITCSECKWLLNNPIKYLIESLSLQLHNCHLLDKPMR